MLRLIKAFTSGRADISREFEYSYDPGVCQSDSAIVRSIELSHSIKDPLQRALCIVDLCKFALEEERLHEAYQGLWLLSHYQGEMVGGGIPHDPLSVMARREAWEHARAAAVERENGVVRHDFRAAKQGIDARGVNIQAPKCDPYDLSLCLLNSGAGFPDEFLGNVRELTEDQAMKYAAKKTRGSVHPSQDERLEWVRHTFQDRYATMTERVVDRRIDWDDVIAKRQVHENPAGTVLSGPDAWFR